MPCVGGSLSNKKPLKHFVWVRLEGEGLCLEGYEQKLEYKGGTDYVASRTHSSKCKVEPRKQSISKHKGGRRKKILSKRIAKPLPKQDGAHITSTRQQQKLGSGKK